MKRIAYIIFILVLNTTFFANNKNGEKSAASEMKTIYGKILSNTGEEVVGAKIVIKETAEVYYSDLNGNFSIEVSAKQNTSLIIEQLGFATASLKSDELKQFAEVKLSEL